MDKRFTPAVIAAAQAGQAAYKVPASVTLAQWALESAYGAHMPLGSNNPFGIKARASEPSVPAKTWEVVNGQRIDVVQSFRKFSSLAEAFEAHARLLATSKYYTKAMAKTDDPQAFAIALTGVYATDPGYGPKLISIMKANGLFAIDKAPLAQPVATVPAATVSAQPPAASKEPNMTNTAASPLAQAHPNVAKALPGVDFFQGAINQAEALAGQLFSTITKAKDATDSSVSIQGDKIVASVGGGIVGTIHNVEGAYSKILEIVADAKKGDVREAVADGVDLGSLVFATLDSYKVDLPVVTAIFLNKPNLHSGGTDKPA